MFVTAYQTSLLGAGDPAVDPTVPFERLRLDDVSWVDVARGWLHGADTLLDALITRCVAATDDLDTFALLGV